MHSKKLERAGLIKCKSRISMAPKRGILLDPLTDRILSPSDLGLIEGSIVALDCSWKKIEDSIRMIKRTTRLESASSRFYWQVIPSVGARAGCVQQRLLIALHCWTQRRGLGLLAPFPFGDSFMSLNQQPLDAYASCSNEQEVSEVQWEFFDP